MMRRVNRCVNAALPSLPSLAFARRTQFDGTEKSRAKRKWQYEPVKADKKPRNYTEELAAEYKEEVDELLNNPLDEKGVPRHLPNNGYWDVKKFGMRRRLLVMRDRPNDHEKLAHSFSHLPFIRKG